MKEEEKLNETQQLAFKIADELSEGREFECDSFDIYRGAMRMADWKDQHPRKGLWDGEKVIGWLKNNSHKYVVCDESDFSHYAYNSLIDDLRKAMEE